MLVIYALTIIVLILSVFCQINISSTFKKYNKRGTSRGMQAFQVARAILDENGLQQVQIRQVRGKLTDHYDPRTNTVRLSDAVYASTSVGAAGIAAHECGHAIQHNARYAPIVIRNSLFPVVNIAQHLWYLLFIAGMLLSFLQLYLIGVALFGFVALFQLVTLPVELNASARAMRILGELHILENDELKGARKVLTAAAMTYVAALAMSVLQLLRMLLNVRR